MAAVPEVRQAESIEEKFQRLAAIWHAETDHHSSTSIITKHWAYQEIIGLGPAVVPLLLRDLEIKSPRWFRALHIITRARPFVSPADRGKARKVAEAWLNWGRGNGYRW